jgi:Fe-S-cluster containining protein
MEGIMEQESDGPGSVLDNYRALIAKVDRLCAEIIQRHADAVNCRGGCDACCRHLTLFPVEAVALRLALDTLDHDLKKVIQDRAGKSAGDACPLLDQGLCLMYRHRPIICRTHGMPVLTDRGDGPAVDFCPLNFRGVTRLERESIIDLDQLNTALALINRLFVSQCLDTDSPRDRISLAEALLMELG